MGALIWFTMTPPTSNNWTLRASLVATFALLKGVSLGPLLNQISSMNPSTVPLALFLTSAIFACFSIAALTCAGSRTQLLLRGTLGSALTVLSGISIVNLFVRSSSLFSLELCLGLVVFVGFIFFDTQLILAKAKAGSDDVLGHALDLYVNFVALFVRILLILRQKEESQQRKKSRRTD